MKAVITESSKGDYWVYAGYSEASCLAYGDNFIACLKYNSGREVMGPEFWRLWLVEMRTPGIWGCVLCAFLCDIQSSQIWSPRFFVTTMLLDVYNLQKVDFSMEGVVYNGGFKRESSRFTGPLMKTNNNANFCDFLSNTCGARIDFAASIFHFYGNSLSWGLSVVSLTRQRAIVESEKRECRASRGKLELKFTSVKTWPLQNQWFLSPLLTWRGRITVNLFTEVCNYWCMPWLRYLWTHL